MENKDTLAKELETSGYNPTIHGAVVAIRIYFMDDRNPMADLAFAFGGTVTIEWTNVTQREKYSKGITGYTLIYDLRPKDSFSAWVKPYYKDAEGVK